MFYARLYVQSCVMSYLRDCTGQKCFMGLVLGYLRVFSVISWILFGDEFLDMNW
jgi:hypothetical protein